MTMLLDDVHHMTRENLASVSALARRAVEVAAMLGDVFSFDHVAAMLDVSPAWLLGPVEELVLAGLLADDGNGIVFPGERTRQAVVETVPRSARPALQRRAIDVLLQAGASPIEPATHLATSAQAGGLGVVSALLAASRALGSSDPDAAVELSRRAFELSAAGDLRAAVAAETALLLHAADRAGDGKAFADAALRERLAPEQDAEIRLSIARMSALSPEMRAEAGRSALASPLPVALRARHLSQLVDNILEAGRVEVARELLPETVTAVTSSGDATATLALGVAKSRLAYMDGAFQQALRRIDMSFIAVQRVARPHVGVAEQRRAEQWRAELLLVCDEFDAAHHAAADGVAAARRDRQAWDEKSWKRFQGRHLLQAGRLSDAAATLEGTLAAADDAVMSAHDAAALLALGRIAIHRGDGRALRTCASLAERTLEHAAPEVRRHAAWFLALNDAAGGDPARARARLGALGEGGATSVSPLLMVDVTDPPQLVRIALAAGDDELARSAVAVAERRHRRNPDVGSIAAAAAHARGLLTGDLAALAQATELFADGLRPVARASAHEDYGLQLVRDGNRAGGVEEFGHALQIYSSAGAAWDSARVRRRLRELGVRRRLVKRVRPTSGWAGLTDAEIAVVRLVADGLTNREAAERLFISVHTVSMHLRHAFTKLDVNSRVELTRLVFVNEEAA
ncbi:MAG: LuxR family transcriptional regulator [Actinomycetia bacterium]|nr:LuxR family transcriptional regulator [Actinomycetes bacterium]